MKRLLLITLLFATPACGPSVGDYTGHYTVDVTQSLTNCSRSADEANILEDLETVDISAGNESDLVVKAGVCSFKAQMTEKGLFTVSSQSCTVDEEPEARITVSGEGEVLDGALTLSLSGSFHTTDFGYSVDCDYSAVISTP